jgi:hypothetical protein
MELILEALWLLVEIAVEMVFGAVELGAPDLVDVIADPPPRRFWACVGYVAAGFALGASSAWLLPQRQLPVPRTQGVSLVVSPALSGLAMYSWGSYRRGRGRSASGLATFWGGASFAFGCALGRFVVIG